MKLERIQTIQRLPIGVEEAWDFFINPQNLAAMTPAWLDYRLNHAPPEYVHPGALFSAVIRPIPGLSLQWLAEIKHIRPPIFFITEQRIGPFKLWHHEHHFREIDEGVEIEDLILYGLHLGPVGAFFHDIFVRKRLQEVFTYRARSLEHRFGSIQKPRQPQQAPPPSPHMQKPQPRPRPQPPQRRKPQQQDPPQNPTNTPGKTITIDDIFGGTTDD